MQPAGQLTGPFIDQSLSIPTPMQPAGQFTGPFFDQILNLPMPMPPAGQLTRPVVDQIPNIPTHMPPAGQLIGPFIDQSPNVPTHMPLVEQSTIISLDQSHSTPTNIPGTGQFTTNATNQRCNVSDNIQPLGQHSQAPIKHGGNTTTNVPPNGQTTPAPARYASNGNHNVQATRKSCPASAKGRKKHPAVVEDKDIERSASEYNISYDKMIILKDYANARLKGIETSEPKDAPSRYIISRFEKVRREHPEHATWPYDIPKEKIIRLLPGQKRQDRAPIKSHHSACEKRREELDAHYHESRQWEGPPPPTPNQTNPNTLTAPGINDIPTGLTPPPSSPARVARSSTMMQHDSMDFSDKIPPSAASYDVPMDGSEGGVQLPIPLPPPTTTPTQPDSLKTQNYLVDGRATSDDVHMAGTEEPAHLPLPPPTSTPREQRSEDLLNDYNPSAVSDDSQYDYLFEEPDQVSSPLPTFKSTEEDNIILPENSNQPAVPDNNEYDELFGQSLQSLDDSELDDSSDEQAQRSPEHITHWPLHQDRSQEGHPFTLPHLDSWPPYAPIICHPLVRALEVHAGRKDPFENEQFKGYTIPVANYKARVPQVPAPAESSSKPEAEFMPQGYEMTAELRKEIEQRIVMHMRQRWGMYVSYDDLGKMARSGELVREDLSRLGKETRGWRYKLVYWVEKWGLGGVQGSELSEDCTIQMFCSGKIGF